MKLYHSPRTRSLRVVWMLEEMGLAYELVSLPFPATTNPELLAVNPLGTVPVLLDGDVKLIESNAIMEYLGRRYGPTPLVPPVDDPAYPAYLDYLHFGESTLAAPLSHIVRTRFMAPEAEKDNWTARKIGDVFLHRLTDLARVLDDRTFIAGDDFTAADIAVSYALIMGKLLRYGDRYPERLNAYLTDTTGREAYKRAAAKT